MSTTGKAKGIQRSRIQCDTSFPYMKVGHILSLSHIFSLSLSLSLSLTLSVCYRGACICFGLEVKRLRRKLPYEKRKIHIHSLTHSLSEYFNAGESQKEQKTKAKGRQNERERKSNEWKEQNSISSDEPCSFYLFAFLLLFLLHLSVYMCVSAGFILILHATCSPNKGHSAS